MSLMCLCVSVCGHVAVCCLQGAGVEIYPGSVCSLIGNGIHHCKDGILIKVGKEEVTPPNIWPVGNKY